MTDPFFHTLNYSSINEDWRTEAAGLQSGQGDTILCVTGSGARPLDLLMHNPATILAIDLNPVQNHLLRLKIAAMRHLSYEEYAAFLGLWSAEGPWRLKVLEYLSGDLDPECRTYWKQNYKKVQSGVLYAGRWERYFRQVSKLARIVRTRTIHQLMVCDNLETQRVLVRDHWDTGMWRVTFAMIFHPLTLHLFFGDPAFYHHVNIPVAATLYERMRDSLMSCLARDNFMMSLLLGGTLTERDLPPHLSPDGYKIIRARISGLEVLDSDLTSYLHRQAPATFTRFSLSDVPSFLSFHEFVRLLEGVRHCAAPSARVVIRQFLTRYPISPHLREYFNRFESLEQRLASKDRAFAYEFIVAEVNHE